MQNLVQPFRPLPRAREVPGHVPARAFGVVDVVLARALQAYMLVVARSSAWAWTDARGRFVDGSVVDPRLDLLARRRQPIIVSYYIADALGVAALGLMHPEFRRVMSGLSCVVDDTVAGRASGVFIDRFGGRFAMLPRPDDPDRMLAVYDVIKRGESCAFPVDGGGPYRHVGTGVIGLAAALQATIVPLAVRVTPALVFAPQSRVRVPTPRCRVVAAMGDDIAVMRTGNRRAVAAELQRALDELAFAVEHPS